MAHAHNLGLPTRPLHKALNQVLKPLRAWEGRVQSGPSKGRRQNSTDVVANLPVRLVASSN